MNNPVKSYYFALGYKDADSAPQALPYWAAADDRVQKLPVPPMEEWPEDLE